jgi:hypothetical protein
MYVPPENLRLPVDPINIRLGFETVLATVHVQRLVHKTRNTSTVQVQIAYPQNKEWQHIQSLAKEY